MIIVLYDGVGDDEKAHVIRLFTDNKLNEVLVIDEYRMISDDSFKFISTSDHLTMGFKALTI